MPCWLQSPVIMYEQKPCCFFFFLHMTLFIKLSVHFSKVNKLYLFSKSIPTGYSNMWEMPKGKILFFNLLYKDDRWNLVATGTILLPFYSSFFKFSIKIIRVRACFCICVTWLFSALVFVLVFLLLLFHGYIASTLDIFLFPPFVSFIKIMCKYNCKFVSLWISSLTRCSINLSIWFNMTDILNDACDMQKICKGHDYYTVISPLWLFIADAMERFKVSQVFFFGTE